jgi:acetyl/propionyl-CoA carboxylase alpha subunit
VEHPVTEAITGCDLVEWQLRVAAGEALPLKQSELRIAGHAIEARIYAEDPLKGFLPSTGRLEWLHLPQSVRVDTGVREGDTVSPFYDPMIAKVISHDATREGAAAKLAAALAEVEIAGLQTNGAFLSRALTHADYVRGQLDTGFIERHLSELVPAATTPARALQAAAQYIVSEHAVAGTSDPWATHDGFRLGARSRTCVEFTVAGERILVEVLDAAAPEKVVRLASGAIAVMDQGETFVVHPYDPFAAADALGAATDRIVTPMPGKIVQLLVKAGDTVKRGQPLAVLEAMKMEHTLSAPSDDLIETVNVTVGDQVSEGSIVLRFARDKAA